MGKIIRMLSSAFLADRDHPGDISASQCTPCLTAASFGLSNTGTYCHASDPNPTRPNLLQPYSTRPTLLQPYSSRHTCVASCLACLLFRRILCTRIRSVCPPAIQGTRPPPQTTHHALHAPWRVTSPGVSHPLMEPSSKVTLYGLIVPSSTVILPRRERACHSP